MEKVFLQQNKKIVMKTVGLIMFGLSEKHTQNLPHDLDANFCVLLRKFEL